MSRTRRYSLPMVSQFPGTGFETTKFESVASIEITISGVQTPPFQIRWYRPATEGSGGGPSSRTRRVAAHQSAADARP